MRNKMRNETCTKTLIRPNFFCIFCRENGLKVTNFETTPVMSTYLIAFIVSNFKYNEIPAGIAENPTIQRVYTSVNKLNQTTYALNEGVSLLNSISSYLDVPFSLKKMDQVAIPNDYFSAGGIVFCCQSNTKFNLIDFIFFSYGKLGYAYFKLFYFKKIDHKFAILK